LVAVGVVLASRSSSETSGAAGFPDSVFAAATDFVAGGGSGTSMVLAGGGVDFDAVLDREELLDDE
jgi:hypothetical protein